MSEPHIETIRTGGTTVTIGFASENDHIARVIRQTGTFYEAELLNDIRQRLFFPQQAVDVGAHVGNHAIYFSRVLDMHTIAFEPNPVSFWHLESNIAANGLSGRCRARRAAVGAQAGRAHVVPAGETNSGLSTAEPVADGESELVTLDDELPAGRPVDIIKIDVEGAELDVLKGAERTLKEHRPLLYIEIMQARFEPVTHLLRERGYVCWKRFNATPTFLFLPGERFGRPAN
jgi:FkbM family methyltransferase